jgi:hypothetical protein
VRLGVHGSHSAYYVCAAIWWQLCIKRNLAMKTKEISLDLKGTLVQVIFTYEQWDHYHPEDGYQVEVQKVSLKGVDITDILSDRILRTFESYAEANLGAFISGDLP